MLTISLAEAAQGISMQRTLCPSQDVPQMAGNTDGQGQKSINNTVLAI